jgi:hypothetical protein
MGFVMTPEEAQTLIDENPRNREVLFPYLNGEDLNSRPDQSASRWVINFRDWPLDRSADGTWSGAEDAKKAEWRRSGRVPKDYPEPVAADFPDCLQIIEAKVRPERQRRKPDGSYQLRSPLPHRYWQFGDKRPELYATIAGQKSVLVTAQTSNKWAPAFEPTGIVFSHTIVVFPCPEFWHYAVMQSALHEHWRLEYGASLKQDARYTPSDCYDTFPFPSPSTALQAVGEGYHSERAAMTRRRGEGLTQLYKQFHDATVQEDDIKRLRELHTDLDTKVVRIYGWNDLLLHHGFHETKQGVRFTVSPSARQEILDRLLELNHQRYAEEVANGLHEKGASKGKSGATGKKVNRAASRSPLLEGV